MVVGIVIIVGVVVGMGVVDEGVVVDGVVNVNIASLLAFLVTASMLMAC